jgi:hypothetical protein
MISPLRFSSLNKFSITTAVIFAELTSENECHLNQVEFPTVCAAQIQLSALFDVSILLRYLGAASSNR